jgi:fatty-acyl-CoA synthase
LPRLATAQDLADIESVPLPDRDIPLTTYELVQRAASTWPDATASVWIPDPSRISDARAWTFAELERTVHRLGNTFLELGVERTDAVTLIAPNTSMLFAAFLGAQAVGIAAPMNPVFDMDRISHLIRTTGSRIVVAAGPEIDEHLWNRVRDGATGLGITALLALRPDNASGPAPTLGSLPGVTVDYLGSLATRSADGALASSPPTPGDLAAFFHTGGTTGDPKVAAHTHANEAFMAWSLAVASGLEPGASIIAGLPLFHVNALMVTGLAPIASGSRAVWPGPLGYRDPALYEHFWQLVERYQAYAMSAVPTVYAKLADVPVDAGISSLLMPAVGAAPLPRAVRDGFAARTGLSLREGYGLTEATCASAVTLPGSARPGSAGQRLPYQSIKSVAIDADGAWTDLPPGETGELVIAGPSVFPGYVRAIAGRRELYTDGAVVDGWLRTGDLGSVSSDQTVFLQGRSKDVIIRGGHNIDPAVIEQALLTHSDVLAAAAVGRPDRRSGEVPVAYVALRPGASTTSEDLLQWASSAIDEPAGRPVQVTIVPAIPLTPVGKPFKPALRQDAAVAAARCEIESAAIRSVDVAASWLDGRLTLTLTGPDEDLDAAAALLHGFDFTVRKVRP